MWFNTLIRNRQVSLIFPSDTCLFCFICLHSGDLGVGKRWGKFFKNAQVFAYCNCVNIIMLLDDYRIWRPVTILHLFLWERICSARKGFALCCASMQMCVICFLFLVSVFVCCVALSSFDAWLWSAVLQSPLFCWILVKHWSSFSVGVMLMHKSKKDCAWILNVILHFILLSHLSYLKKSLIPLFDKSSFVVVVVIYIEDYKGIAIEKALSLLLVLMQYNSFRTPIQRWVIYIHIISFPGTMYFRLLDFYTYFIKYLIYKHLNLHFTFKFRNSS